MKIIDVEIDKLKPYEKNAKLHTQKQIDSLAMMIAKVGMIQPVVIGKDNTIIIGHGRTEAARQAGLTTVPVVRLDDLTEAEERSLRLFDNKVAETGFDLSLLKEEVFQLSELPDFNIELTGFDMENFTEMLPEGSSFKEQHEADKEAEQEKADAVPETEQNQFNVQRGQVWQLGRHRLMCGDSTSEADIAKLMNGQKADMVFTDPPYNAGFLSEEIMNDNFKTIEEFISFSNEWFKNSLTFSKENSSFYIWCYEKTGCELKVSFNQYKLEFCNLIIWDKVSLGRTLPKFKSGKELCLFYKRGEPVFNNQRMKARPSLKERWGHLADSNGDVKQGKYRCNVNEGPCTDVWWDIPNMGRGGNKEYLAEHPTQKPLMACERGILASSNENNAVLDLFLGSGSTLIACEKTNRVCFGCELNEHYCSVIINRWQEFTGLKAQLLEG